MTAEIRAELRAVARASLGGLGIAATLDWAVLAGWDWLGLEVPAALDGADATFAEVAVVLVELGRAAARAPYLGAVALGVGALREAAPGAARDELLAAAAAGRAVPVAVQGDDAAFRLVRGPGGQELLSGRASFVPDAADASVLLVCADTDDGPVLTAVRPDAAGVAVTPQPVLDATRSLAAVGCDGVPIDRATRWPLAAAGVARLTDRAAVALACDSLGIAEAMLAATVSYVRVRGQFGRPIGSFQAVKHACADMYVQVSVARELVAAAVAAIADPAAPVPEASAAASVPAVSAAASMAKAYAGEAAVAVAGKAMQLHGGIGYAAESGVHVYLKRAALNRDLFGSPVRHRARLALRYGPFDSRNR